MRRVGYVKDRFSSFSHGSRIYFFINLYLLYNETREDRRNSILVNAITHSGAPYEKELAASVIAIQDDNTMAASPFRYTKRTEEDVSEEELFDLWKKMKGL